MATADWKSVHQEPEDYGTYLVKVKGRTGSTVARFDHPMGERSTGWFELTEGGMYRVEITHWDHLPD